MSRSWAVTVQSVRSLKHAEYRFGDLTERTGQKLLNSVSTMPWGCKSPTVAKDHMILNAADDVSTPSSLLSADAAETGSLQSDTSRSCARLGSVAVELQVDSLKKRTRPFQVSGETVVSVNEKIFMPEPASGSNMVVRVWRVGHLQDDALIGEGVVSEALGTSIQVPLHRKRSYKGNEKGYVTLTVAEVDTDVTPVLEARSVSPHPDSGVSSSSLSASCGFFKDKRNRLVDKYMQVDLVHMRQPLLQRSADAPSVGECKVIIETARELAKKAARPYFVLNLDGQEIRIDPETLSSASQAELTYTFRFSGLHCNLAIYCYDDHGTVRNAAVGRIIIPLSGVPWAAGEGPRLRLLRRVVTPGAGTFGRRYVAQFMPLSAAGDGSGQLAQGFVDRFTAARTRKDGKAIPGSGMYKKMAFGLLTLRLEVTLDPDMRPPVKCYFAEARAHFDALLGQSEQDQEQTVAPPNLDLMSLMQSKVVNQTMRNIERLEALAKARPQGILRWLRARQENGIMAGTAWFIFCSVGLFPPQGWAWPLYAWALLALNGMAVAFQREADWEPAGSQAFPVWNEELEPQGTPSLTDLMNSFTKGLHFLNRSTRIFSSFAERAMNLFVFADGVATVLCLLLLGAVAISLSALILLWSFFDPSGTWFWALAGSIACIALSRQASDGAGKKEKKDPLAGLEKLERMGKVMDFVPDQPEMAHRFIATRVQCHVEGIELKVTIVSARGLRNADHMLGQGLSDPYCVCSIPGKPLSRFWTQVIDDNLNPEWNYEGRMTSYSVGDSLDFHVWDKDLGMRDDFLGKARLTSKQFYPMGFDGEVVLQEAGVGYRPKLKLKVEVLMGSGPDPQPLGSLGSASSRRAVATVVVPGTIQV